MFVAVMQECIKVSHSDVSTGKECKSYTRSPCVPHLPWLAHCSRWNFLQDTGGVHLIHSLHYLFMYLYFRCKVYSYPVMHTKIIFSQHKTAFASLQK